MKLTAFSKFSPAGVTIKSIFSSCAERITVMAHNKTLEEEFKRALDVIFRTECNQEEAKQIVQEVVQYWKESVNPGAILLNSVSYECRIFGVS